MIRGTKPVFSGSLLVAEMGNNVNDISFFCSFRKHTQTFMLKDFSTVTPKPSTH
jgi:hypothetical protein